jgi:hypothetical protein
MLHRELADAVQHHPALHQHRRLVDVDRHLAGFAERGAHVGRQLVEALDHVARRGVDGDHAAEVHVVADALGGGVARQRLAGCGHDRAPSTRLTRARKRVRSSAVVLFIE